MKTETTARTGKTAQSRKTSTTARTAKTEKGDRPARAKKKDGFEGVGRPRSAERKEASETRTRNPFSATAIAAFAQQLAIDPMHMPDEITKFMQKSKWGQMHLQWHAVRRKDAFADLIAKMKWTPAKLQEGDKGNGFEFFIMHRAMLRMLTKKFPQFAELFKGWTDVPTDPKSNSDPCPPGTAALDPRAQKSIALLSDVKGNWDHFKDMDDDAFGRFIQTSVIGQGAQSWSQDLGMAGLHNYLHNRFQNPKSQIDMGDPTRNLFNQEFWRLHGWIDSRFTEFRALKGETEDDPAYKKALANATMMMSMPMKGVDTAARALTPDVRFPHFFDQP